MKLKKNIYYIIIFLILGTNYSNGQFNEYGFNDTPCQWVARRYAIEMDSCIRDFSEIQYAASGLPDLRDDYIKVIIDLLAYAGGNLTHSLASLYSAFDNLDSYIEVESIIYGQQSISMDRIAEDYFEANSKFGC